MGRSTKAPPSVNALLPVRPARDAWPQAKWDWVKSPFRFSLPFEHDLSENRYPLFGIML
jgi:hypothetical protein